MTDDFTLTAGVHIPWRSIEGFFMCVRSFTRLAQVSGPKVGGSVLGTYGVAQAELPNPDVDPHKRMLSIPIKNKSDYKSFFSAHLDTGVKSGDNELVILYEHRKNLLGGRRPCFHVAIYPTGTWNNFFQAVANYQAQEFKWPRPLILYQPSPTNVFPTTKNIFRK